MFDAALEFDRQVRVLDELDYPALAGLTPEAFTDLVTPLREKAVARTHEEPTRERVPFLLVLAPGMVRPEQTVPHLTLAGKAKSGVIDRHFKEGELKNFVPIEGLPVPTTGAYLAFGIDRGPEFLNVTPDEAMPTIAERGRTPLTMEEGIAFATLFPESLEPNNCWMMPGSRCGDRRVPAVWISDKAPKLGWCWAGNRHTWLGIASCADRVTTSS
ncbi:DUF5701 family protein [Tenggerimyces flavus]|uniref:DUF5701 family protein n=1 Tax=Tenggerimyces flavus TaxID=1708749 RepID=A0ABV7YDZ9_9ACTN|nr:DUF5701 family protein [Tenggerimyces flavus]MBM7788120.1 hypothetical protein [Tenggerimyces flavus]